MVVWVGLRCVTQRLPSKPAVCKFPTPRTWHRRLEPPPWIAWPNALRVAGSREHRLRELTWTALVPRILLPGKDVALLCHHLRSLAQLHHHLLDIYEDIAKEETNPTTEKVRSESSKAPPCPREEEREEGELVV